MSFINKLLANADETVHEKRKVVIVDYISKYERQLNEEIKKILDKIRRKRIMKY